MATVYYGDMVLYNVMIMPKTAGEKVKACSIHRAKRVHHVVASSRYGSNVRNPDFDGFLAHQSAA